MWGSLYSPLKDSHLQREMWRQLILLHMQADSSERSLCNLMQSITAFQCPSFHSKSADLEEVLSLAVVRIAALFLGHYQYGTPCADWGC